MARKKFTIGYLYQEEIPAALRTEVISFIQGPASAGVDDTDSMLPPNYQDNLAQAAEEGETPSPAAKAYLDKLVAKSLRQKIDELELRPGKAPKK
jgi:hypothetical protein